MSLCPRRDDVYDIVHKLRVADVLIRQGKTVTLVMKSLGVSELTYYRCRKEYSGISVVQASGSSRLKRRTSVFVKLCMT